MSPAHSPSEIEAHLANIYTVVGQLLEQSMSEPCQDITAILQLIYWDMGAVFESVELTLNALP